MSRSNSDAWSVGQAVDQLKAVAEPTRLRLLSLLAAGDLTVSDLTEILGQSQPRVSRHLRLLLEAGLITRDREGAWAFFRLADHERSFVQSLLSRLAEGDADLLRDRERLLRVKQRRQERAAAFFSRNAADWDAIRSLHAPDSAVETALIRAVGPAPVRALLDLGTGTGRMLELFAPLYDRGLGIDSSREMLAVARANLDRAGVRHAQLRHGDLFSAPAERGAFDLVILHQVLHHLDDPAAAIAEAARFLRPSGRLAVVDFAPHDVELLRERYAHLRLGFSDATIAEWVAAAGLAPPDAWTVRADPGQATRLTVRIWIARDPRVEWAGQSATVISEGETA